MPPRVICGCTAPLSSRERATAPPSSTDLHVHAGVTPLDRHGRFRRPVTVRLSNVTGSGRASLARHASTRSLVLYELETSGGYPDLFIGSGRQSFYPNAVTDVRGEWLPWLRSE